MSDETYCYPGTNILRNKLNVKDPERLIKEEVFHTGVRMFQLQAQPVKGPFNFNKLKAIHAYIFQDLYAWAGKTRTVDIGKGNLFCPVRNIEIYARDVFRSFEADCVAARQDPARFVHVVTNHYADLNALHPFREGNGRTQREFTRQLCSYCGYDFDLTHTKHEEMLAASISSFNKGDNSQLENIFKTAITPITNKTELRHRMKNSIVTLSHDDIPQEEHKTKPMEKRRIPTQPSNGLNMHPDIENWPPPQHPTTSKTHTATWSQPDMETTTEPEL